MMDRNEKLCDGIGLQMHISNVYPSVNKIQICLDAIAEAGYKIQITELDCGVSSPTEANFKTQATKFKSVMGINLCLRRQLRRFSFLYLCSL